MATQGGSLLSHLSGHSTSEGCFDGLYSSQVLQLLKPLRSTHGSGRRRTKPPQLHEVSYKGFKRGAFKLDEVRKQLDEKSAAFFEDDPTAGKISTATRAYGSLSVMKY